MGFEQAVAERALRESASADPGSASDNVIENAILRASAIVAEGGARVDGMDVDGAAGGGNVGDNASSGLGDGLGATDLAALGGKEAEEDEEDEEEDDSTYVEAREVLERELGNSLGRRDLEDEMAGEDMAGFLQMIAQFDGP